MSSRSRALHVVAALAVCALPARGPRLAAQEICDVQELVVGAAHGVPGAAVEVELRGGVSCEVTGFSAAIGHDNTVVAFLGAEPGVFLVEHAGNDLSFQMNGQNEGGYAVVGAIFDISFPLTVPPTTIESGTVLARLSYQISPDAIPGTVTPLLNRTRTYGGAVLVSNIYSRPPGGVPIEPTLVDGQITVDGETPRPTFRRADANDDGDVDIGDAAMVLRHLFLSSKPLIGCEKSGDANDDGGLDIADALAVLQYLFLGGEAPAPPFEGCGKEDTPDELTCEDFASCG